MLIVFLVGCHVVKGYTESSVARMMTIEKLKFLKETEVRDLVKRFETPLYVYDEATLTANADAVKAFPNAYGVTVRFAMKACPNKNILKVIGKGGVEGYDRQMFHERGLSFDCSSGFEVERALMAGIPPEKLCLSSQVSIIAIKIRL